MNASAYTNRRSCQPIPPDQRRPIPPDQHRPMINDGPVARTDSTQALRSADYLAFSIYGEGQSNPSNSRSVAYLTITGADRCGMSLSGPILASCTAARKWSAGASDPLIGTAGCW